MRVYLPPYQAGHIARVGFPELPCVCNDCGKEYWSKSRNTKWCPECQPKHTAERIKKHRKRLDARRKLARTMARKMAG